MFQRVNRMVFIKCAMLFVLIAVALVACGGEDLGTAADAPGPKTISLPTVNNQKEVYDLWNGQGSTGAPKYPEQAHLRSCGASSPDNFQCPDGMMCLNLGNGGVCLFECDIAKGELDKQNPDCNKPENCIRLNNGGGACVFFPATLYGSGSYSGVVRLEPGERCLLQYGGCDDGYICVDDKEHGSKGICKEACRYPTSKTDINQPKCNTANTVCTRLASGFAACLEKK